MTNYTIRPFKGRTVEVGDAIKVHRNLHGKDWSITALAGPYKGLVVAHVDEAFVWGAVFTVSDAGRRRTLEQGRKNVHAHIRGTLGGHIPRNMLLTIRNQVRYNPFQFVRFMVFPRADGGGWVQFAQMIERAGGAQLDTDGKAWAYAPHRLSRP